MWKFVDSACAAYTSILLIEDDQNDAFLFERALHKAGIAGSLSRLRDGEEAISYFKAIAACADRAQRPFPSLLVTDLKMPKVSGFDLLAWIQNEIQPRTFPIIVLTSSVLPEDKSKALALGADHYWVKPSEPTELVTLLQSFKAR
jgi:CheY-like chemotaxis protein